jgi:hypothetical protein
MTEDINAILKSMDEAETAAGSLGGGGSALFCKATIAYGYKVFASGSVHADSFFATAFPPTKEGAKAALEKAKAYKTETGTNASPAFSMVLTINPQDVIGKSVTWKGPQNKVFARWKRKTEDGSKSLLDDIVLPRLVELGCTQPGTYHLRIQYMRDPLNPGTDDNPNILWIPAEVYPNEAATRAASEKWAAEHDSGDNPSAVVNSELPPGWDASAWGKFKPQVDAGLAKGSPEDVGKQWGIPVDWLKAYIAK